jgi:hypothetical protein
MCHQYFLYLNKKKSWNWKNRLAAGMSYKMLPRMMLISKYV